MNVFIAKWGDPASSYDIGVFSTFEKAKEATLESIEDQYYMGTDFIETHNGLKEIEARKNPAWWGVVQERKLDEADKIVNVTEVWKNEEETKESNGA